MSSPIKSESIWMSLIGRILHENKQFSDDAELGSGKTDRAYISRLKYGLAPETEHRAYGDVLPYAEGEGVRREKNGTALLRAAAIVAQHPGVKQLPQKSKDSLGSSFLEFSKILAKKRQQDFTVDPAKPDRIATALLQFPQQDLNSCVLTINRILTLAESTPIPVSINYFALTQMLMHWGNGISESSMAIRRQPIKDYYSSAHYQVQPKGQELS